MLSKKVVLSVCVVILGYYWLNYVKRGPIYKTNKSLVGKTVLITGGNSGVGKSTALEMAKKGARVIIASRNLAKSNLAKEEIVKKTGNKDIKIIQLDLADFESVRSLAEEIQSEEYLDFLINNAGVNVVPGRLDSGINKIFAINHFGHFLLTNLLLDKLKAQSKSRPVRIINLTSEMYRFGRLSNEEFYGNPLSFLEMFHYYSHTKLANIYFTSGLVDRLKGYDVTVYSVHPGRVISEIGHQFSPFFKTFVVWVFGPLFLRDPHYGTQTTLYCALDDEVVKLNGAYFSDCAEEELWSHATNKSVEKYLWEESIKVTQLLNK